MSKTKIKEYKIIEETSIKYLVDEINNAILDGWEPLGGIATCQVFEQTYFHQAMIKRYE